MVSKSKIGLELKDIPQLDRTFLLQKIIILTIWAISLWLLYNNHPIFIPFIQIKDLSISTIWAYWIQVLEIPRQYKTKTFSKKFMKKSKILNCFKFKETSKKKNPNKRSEGVQTQLADNFFLIFFIFFMLVFN